MEDESDPSGDQPSEPEDAQQSPLTPSVESSFFAASSPASDVDRSGGPSPRLIVGIVAAVVVVAAVIVGIVIFGSSVADAFISGSGTATITWTPAAGNTNSNTGSIDNVPQPFSGTVGGETVTGTAKTTLMLGSGGSPFASSAPGSLVSAFRWSGEFGGKPFDLGLFFKVPAKASPFFQPTQLIVKGTYNGEPVNAVVTGPDSGQSTGPAEFHGTIGSWKVSGSVNAPTGNSNQEKSVVSYNLSK